MKTKYQVFVSSTFADLKGERQAVTRQLIDMGFIPSAMELFPAVSLDQLDYIKRVIDDCDYYLLIIGGRYGSTTTEGISYTESEYDYAVSVQKPVLAFIHDNPGSFAANVVDQEPELRERFAKFRNKVSLGRIVKYWSTQDQLAAQTSASLHLAREHSPATGWIRATSARPSQDEEIKKLQSALWRLEHEAEDAQERSRRAEAAISSLFLDKTKPATEAEIEAWTKGCAATGSTPSRISLHDVRFADQDFILPELY